MAGWTAQTLNGPRRRTVYGKTQAEVVRKRKYEMAEERGGIASDAGRATVGEYFGLWLEDSVKTSVKPITYEGYRQLLRKHPKYVQALPGHATVAITLDAYSHVLPGMDDGLAEAMEDALS